MNATSRMARQLWLASTAVILAAPAVAQTPFEWEVGAEYLGRSLSVTTAFGGDQDVDVDGFGLSAQWFLQPVPTDRGPLERAPFLARASSLSFSYAETEIDDVDADSDALGLGGRIQLNEDWFVTGTYVRSDSSSGAFDSEFTTIGVGAGLYVAQDTSVAARILREEVDFNGGGSDDITSYAVDFEHVSDLGASTWQLALDGSLILPDGEFDETRFSASITMYPTREFGFGFIGAAALQDSDERPQTFGIFGRWFLTEAWSVSANYDWTQLDTGTVEQDDDGFLLGTRYRF